MAGVLGGRGGRGGGGGRWGCKCTRVVRAGEKGLSHSPEVGPDRVKPDTGSRHRIGGHSFLRVSGLRANPGG